MRMAALAPLAFATRISITGVAGFLAATATRAQTPDLIILRETGPRDKRVNIVIIGDGYRTQDRALFQQHAKTMADGIVADLPLTGYAAYCNIYAIFAASAEAGADIPTQGISRNTYFNARYDASLGRLLVIDFTKGFQVIDGLVPERDIPVAVVNSSQYGGSGGSIAVANYSAPEIVAHEVQHSFTNLGDEYDYAGVSPWEAPNTTKKATRTTVTWKHWVAAATPVPTPETSAYANVIGVFEGAAYNQTGWYRPKLTCRMRENGRPFCAVCSEAILLQVYDQVSPLDSALPLAKTVNTGGAPPLLRVVPKVPTTHALKVEWVVDGQVAPAVTGNIFSQPLAQGRHRVTARVSDPTPMVKADPAKVTVDSASWEVVVEGITGVSGSGSGNLSVTGWDRDAVAFRLPSAGAWSLSALAPDGRLLWMRRGFAAAPGDQSLAVGNLPATDRGWTVLRLEQTGRRAVSRHFRL